MGSALRSYTTSMLPISARRFFISVKMDENGRYYGTINQIFYENEEPFYGLDDAVLKIDEMLDELGCVQASTELREFRKKRKLDLSTRTAEERIEAEKKKNFHTQYRNTETLKEDAKQQKNSFVVDIMYRQNSSWQGCVIWGNQSKRKDFRSVLELMKLIRSSFITE